MQSTPEDPTEAKSRLTSEVLTYLDIVAREAAALPDYFPEYLRTVGANKSPFDAIRQTVRVVEDRKEFERWLSESNERQRASGYVPGKAYAPRSSRPEDELQNRSGAPKTITWDERSSDSFTRAFVLGDPGFGKSWLLRYEARRLAKVALDGLSNLTLDLHAELVLPIHVRFSELAETDDPLEDALIAHVCRIAECTEHFRTFVRERLKTKRCVILLDAWDEVPVDLILPGKPVTFALGFRQGLERRLKHFAMRFRQPRMLMTSRVVGYGGAPFDGILELELLAFEKPQITAFVEVWFEKDAGTGEFLQWIEQSVPVRGLARIPLMLTLLCRISQDRNGKNAQRLPTRRTELYESVLRGLLSMWKVYEKKKSAAYLEPQLEMLRAVAFQFFMTGREQFTQAELSEAILAWLNGLPRNHDFASKTPIPLIEELKADGILVATGEERLLFLHRTFQEYLAAGHIAARINNASWSLATVSVSGITVLTTVLLKRIIQRPDCQQFIVLLAGLLKESTPVLEMLQDESVDDLFRHGLALAALCLPELSHAARAHCEAIIDNITSKTVLLLWQHQCNGTEDVAGHLARALPALAQVNAKVNGRRLLDWLADEFNGKNWKSAPKVVEKIGTPACTERILSALAPMLESDDPWVRRSAADAVRCIHGEACTKRILTILASMLEGEDSEARRRGARAVGAIGAPAGTERILTALSSMLESDNFDMFQMAAIAVSGIGAPACTERILTALISMLESEDSTTAKNAVIGIGAPACTENIPRALVSMLENEDPKVRQSAMLAVKCIGKPAGVERILSALAPMLESEDSKIRQSAADAVICIGEPAGTEIVLTTVASMFESNNSCLCATAADIVCGIGGSA